MAIIPAEIIINHRVTCFKNNMCINITNLMKKYTILPIMCQALRWKQGGLVLILVSFFCSSQKKPQELIRDECCGIKRTFIYIN